MLDVDQIRIKFLKDLSPDETHGRIAESVEEATGRRDDVSPGGPDTHALVDLHLPPYSLSATAIEYRDLIPASHLGLGQPMGVQLDTAHVFRQVLMHKM